VPGVAFEGLGVVCQDEKGSSASGRVYCSEAATSSRTGVVARVPVDRSWVVLTIGLEIDRQDAPFTRSLRTFAEILAGLAMAGAVASLSQT